MVIIIVNICQVIKQHEGNIMMQKDLETAKEEVAKHTYGKDEVRAFVSGRHDCLS